MSNLNIRSLVLDAVRWLVIAQFVSQFIRIGVTIFVIRQLESEHMAFIAISQSIVGFLDMFSSLGLSAAIISKKDITRKEISNISGMILMVNFFLGGLVFLASGVVSQIYGIPELENILKFLSLGFLVSALGTISGTLLTKEMRFKEISVIQLLASMAGALSSYLLVVNGFSYWSLIISGLVFLGTRSILQIVISGELIRPSFSFFESLEHLRFGGHVMFAGIAWYLYTSADVVIAGKVWSAEIVGVYAVALQLVLIPMNRLMPILKQVALPAFSKTIAEDSNKLQSYLVKSMRLAMGLCFPFYFGISCTATIIVPLLLGESWIAASIPLMCLSLALPFRFYLELLSPSVIASGYPRRLLLNNIVILLLMVIAFVVTTTLGSEAVHLSLVWVVIFPALSMWASWRSCIEMDVKFFTIFQVIGGACLRSSVMWIVVIALINFSPWSMINWIGLAASIVTGMVTYLLLLFIFDRPLLIDYRRLVIRREKVSQTA